MIMAFSTGGRRANGSSDAFGGCFAQSNPLGRGLRWVCLGPMTRAGTMALSIEGFCRWLVRFWWQIVMLVHSWRGLFGLSNPRRRVLAKHHVKREVVDGGEPDIDRYREEEGPLTEKPGMSSLFGGPETPKDGLRFCT